MDTLKRVGSLRLSRRGRKKESAKRPSRDDDDPATTAYMLAPRPYGTLGRRGGEKVARVYFTLSFKDVVVGTLNGYQPIHLKAIFERRRQTRASEPVLWEPSLTGTTTGSGVWHPPFVLHVAVSVPKIKSKGDGTLLRHKDAFVSIENKDLKGKHKLLAKARLNLSEYFESASEKDVSFRLKLHPESSKVASASVDLTIRKSTEDPTKQMRSSQAAICLDDQEETGSLGDERLLATIPNTQSSSPCNNSIQSIPADQKPPNEISLDVQRVHKDVEGQTESENTRPLILTSTSADTKRPVTEGFVVGGIVATDKSEMFVVPNLVTPPPLPPRQRLISQESPPSSPHELIDNEKVVTSTPLVSNLKAPTMSSSSSSSVAKGKKSVKEIDWDEDLQPSNPEETRQEDEEQPPFTMGINLSACVSPKVTKSAKTAATNAAASKMKTTAEKDLMEWAKQSLLSAPGPPVKVTNLTSAWRNGLGYCIILHQKHPSLIPLQSLSSDNARDNNEIAFDVADLFGRIDTEAIRQMALEKEVTDKRTVSDFLIQLRTYVTDEMTERMPAEKTVIEFQKKWYCRSKYFKEEVGELCKSVPRNSISNLPPSRNNSIEEKGRVQGEKVTENADDKIEAPDSLESNNEDKEKKKECQSEDVSSASPLLSNREKVKQLIAEAHDSSSYEEASTSPPSSSCSEAATAGAAAEGGQLCESVTILEELTQLTREEEQISGELEKLEQVLRSQDAEETDESDFEALLQKYVSLVNEKNSVVRRQMQLNIAKKERAVEHKKEKLQRQLQKFSDLDDSQKTEAMRLEEEMLLQHYVEAVNEKNELVHEFDSQERLIAEDESIRSFVANRDILAKPGQTKHSNVLDEFLDFFKKAWRRKNTYDYYRTRCYSYIENICQSPI